MDKTVREEKLGGVEKSRRDKGKDSALRRTAAHNDIHQNKTTLVFTRRPEKTQKRRKSFTNTCRQTRWASEDQQLQTVRESEKTGGRKKEVKRDLQKTQWK